MTAESSPGPWALAATTPAAWADAVAADPVALLSDHAHCELKAAANTMTMLKRNPDRPGLALRLAPLIREETEHLHRVLRELEARGATLGQDAPNPYAEQLQRVCRQTRRTARTAPEAPGGAGLLDVVLVSALIELRSHERFLRLRACPALSSLAPLYAALCDAEARHGELFVELAQEVAPDGVAAERFAMLATAEAAILAGLPVAPRIHSGVAGL